MEEGSDTMGREWSRKSIEEIFRNYWNKHKGEISTGGGGGEQVDVNAYLAPNVHLPNLYNYICYDPYISNNFGTGACELLVWEVGAKKLGVNYYSMVSCRLKIKFNKGGTTSEKRTLNNGDILCGIVVPQMGWPPVGGVGPTLVPTAKVAIRNVDRIFLTQSCFTGWTDWNNVSDKKIEIAPYNPSRSDLPFLQTQARILQGVNMVPSSPTYHENYDDVDYPSRVIYMMLMSGGPVDIDYNKDTLTVYFRAQSLNLTQAGYIEMEGSRFQKEQPIPNPENYIIGEWNYLTIGNNRRILLNLISKLDTNNYFDKGIYDHHT